MELKQAFKVLKGQTYTIHLGMLNRNYVVIVDDPKSLIKALGINAKDLKGLDDSGIYAYVGNLIYDWDPEDRLSGLSVREEYYEQAWKHWGVLTKY